MKYSELPIKVRDKIVSLSEKYGWSFDPKEYPYMVRVAKNFDYSPVKMNIYWDLKGNIRNVCTHMTHPKKGKGQMFRKITISELEDYFRNPRKHTKKGYGRTLKKLRK